VARQPAEFHHLLFAITPGVDLDAAVTLLLR
jgi:hypothetical protein